MTSTELLPSEVADHITTRIAESPLVLDPFPHLVTDDVLPSSVFSRIVADLPAADELVSMSAIGLRNVARYEKHRTAEVKDVPDRSDPDVWRLLESAVLHPSIEESLRALFRPHVTAASDDRDVIRELRLDCGLTGAYLPPHTDSPMVLMKTLIYVGAGSDIPNADTLLYAPKDTDARRRRIGADDFTAGSYQHEAAEDHDEVARIGFKANRMLTFFRTPDSLHGLETLLDEVAPRFILAGHYRFATER